MSEQEKEQAEQQAGKQAGQTEQARAQTQTGAGQSTQTAGAYTVKKDTTLEEFVHLPEMKPLKSNLSWSAGLSYFAAVIMLINMIIERNPIYIAFTAAFIICGYLTKRYVSLAAAIGVTVSASVFVIFTAIKSGALSGWILILIGVYCIFTAVMVKKAWVNYRSGKKPDFKKRYW